jgi:hypothetical protein
VRAEENGLLFEPHKPAKLASALHHLATDAETKARLQKGAAATELRSASEYGSAMRLIYEEAIANPRAEILPGTSQEKSFLLEALHTFGFDRGQANPVNVAY